MAINGSTIYDSGLTKGRVEAIIADSRYFFSKISHVENMKRVTKKISVRPVFIVAK